MRQHHSIFSVALFLSACTGGLGAPGQGGVNINICNLADTDGGCTQSGTNSNVSQTAIDGDAVDDATREAADLARDILGIEGAENPPPGGGTPPPGGGTPPPGGGGTAPKLILSAQILTPILQGGPIPSGAELHAISGFGQWNIPRSMGGYTDYDLAPLVFAAGSKGTVIRWAPGTDAVGSGGIVSPDNVGNWISQTGIVGPTGSEHVYKALSTFSFVYDAPPADPVEYVHAVAAGTSTMPNNGVSNISDGIFAERQGGTSSLAWEASASAWRVTDSNTAQPGDFLDDALIRGAWATALTNPVTGELISWRVLVGGDDSIGGGIIVHEEQAVVPADPSQFDNQTHVETEIVFNAVHGAVGQGQMISAYAVGKTTSGTGVIFRLSKNYEADPIMPDTGLWQQVTLPSSPNGPPDELTAVFVASKDFVIAVSVSGQLVICESPDISTPLACEWRIEKPVGTVAFTGIHGVWAPQIASIYQVLDLDDPPSRYYPFYLLAVAEDGGIYRSSYFDLASQGAWTRISNQNLANAAAASLGLSGNANFILDTTTLLNSTGWNGVWTSAGSKDDAVVPQFWVDSYLVGYRQTGTTNHLWRLREELPLVELIGSDALIDIIAGAVP